MSGKKESSRRGREGEAIVRRALERRGVEILASNWHCPWGELDLVAATPTHVRFIEVKTRTSADCMEAREAVDGPKRRKLTRAAACWLQEHPREQRLCVFDVAEVYLRGDEHTIRYYANAFEAEE